MYCIVLYGLSLTASFVDSFVGRSNGRFSKWCVDWPFLPLIYWLYNRQGESFAHTFLRAPRHAFGDWPIR